MSPQALEDSVRPRRLIGALGRPLNFTVSSHVDRYHFVVTAALALCAAAITIGFVWKQPGLLGVSALLGWTALCPEQHAH